MATSVNTLDSLQILVVGRYIDMAAGSLIIFDSLLTLDLERKFIWKSKWNMMKVMYIANRYSAILQFIVVCILRTQTDTTHCPGFMKAQGDIILPPFNGCLADLLPSAASMSVVFLVAYDAAMTLFIGWVAFGMWRTDDRVWNHVFKVLYGEGVLFYTYLLALSIAAVVAASISNPYLFIL
ncbi:hypothetical protein AGABI1DRAFT_132698 [Agaricus bisporus var. burnettii JB137-S8]|uniref:DUF6533 domain-containing protein n=1 Tax=Agaricus bisporus var. burnettii (strain JB137-S8 / ATCC MYA-4627 / FGSC 10392) TaxID=597362 RepID=K5WWN1_AGABU|nr:uncharacterized protein AGABI1DRAFT_132698 [Agaricus bisporus var. burnettii JB137-S8]EKM74997.1 hypothetical protein AGABI1DRAFT_132698 [Agaricus bisporus var. burnettii JB137-S8]